MHIFNSYANFDFDLPMHLHAVLLPVVLNLVRSLKNFSGTKNYTIKLKTNIYKLGEVMSYNDGPCKRVHAKLTGLLQMTSS